MIAESIDFFITLGIRDLNSIFEKKREKIISKLSLLKILKRKWTCVIFFMPLENLFQNTQKCTKKNLLLVIFLR